MKEEKTKKQAKATPKPATRKKAKTEPEKTPKGTATAKVKKEPKAAKPKSGSGGKSPITGAVGRRKTAIARVWMRRGSGKITVNTKDFKNYFDTDVARLDASSPLRVVPNSNYDFEANVEGGGPYAQAGAVKLAIARAMVKVDQSVKSILRKHGLLTVDSRQKERKKYGQRGARRKFQFVKR